MRKKILICNPFISVGGIATYTFSLGKGLIKTGKQVYFVSTHYKGDFWSEVGDSFSAVFTIEEVKNPLLKIFRIIRLIKKLKPNVIIINNCPTINYAIPFIDRSINVISVIHSDDNRYYELDTRFHGWINYLVCPSLKVKKTATIYVSEKSAVKVKYIPHGIKIFDNLQIENKIKNSLIFVGNLDAHKGVNMFMPILKKLTKDFKSTHLYIVGRGPLKNELIKNFNKNGLAENVTFLGTIKKKALYELFSKMEVLLFPTQLESFGLVIPEAMSCGVIPVISNLEGITDQFILQGSNGFLCDKNNEKDFFQNIVKIFRDNKLKKTLRENSRNFVLEKFTEKNMLENYNYLINDKLDIFKPKLYSLKWFKLYFESLIKIIQNG